MSKFQEVQTNKEETLDKMIACIAIIKHEKPEKVLGVFSLLKSYYLSLAGKKEKMSETAAKRSSIIMRNAEKCIKVYDEMMTMERKYVSPYCASEIVMIGYSGCGTIFRCINCEKTIGIRQEED